MRSKFPEKINADIDGKVDIFKYRTVSSHTKIVFFLQIMSAGDFKGARIAENMNNNELCKQTMEIFASVSILVLCDELLLTHSTSCRHTERKRV